MVKHEGTELAPEGHIWQCLDCGNKARSKAGFDEKGASTAAEPGRGWDITCFQNAVLVRLAGFGRVAPDSTRNQP